LGIAMVHPRQDPVIGRASFAAQEKFGFVASSRPH
jgi:hypothetical protein